MKRNATLRSPNHRQLPLAWREAEYAALRAEVADTCDDRVSQNIFDVEDERAEIDVVVHGMMHDAS
jgi:hypothetical protein